MKNHFHYILFYKPYGVLSQFTREAGHLSLTDFGPFPGGVYAAGRLDADSEGLRILRKVKDEVHIPVLTNDNRVKQELTDPGYRHVKTYLAQVELIPTETGLENLRKGIPLEGKQTLPARIRLLDVEPALPPRPVPIRFRKNVPTSWLEVILMEGRNRQVRKMTAAVGCPTLRLIRTRISFLSLEGMLPGQSRPLTGREVVKLRSLADLPR